MLVLSNDVDEEDLLLQVKVKSGLVHHNDFLLLTDDGDENLEHAPLTRAHLVYSLGLVVELFADEEHLVELGLVTQIAIDLDILKGVQLLKQSELMRMHVARILPQVVSFQV